MDLSEFKAAQDQVEAHFAGSGVFASLVPVVLRMYCCARDLAQPRSSPTLGRLLMLCHREFLVAASQIQRGLPYDAAANTRRATEIARVALALKRDPENAHKWLHADVRQARWDARSAGNKPPRLPSVQFPEVDGDPLYASLKDYFGIYSDAYIHFTPEFLGIQQFPEDLE